MDSDQEYDDEGMFDDIFEKKTENEEDKQENDKIKGKETNKRGTEGEGKNRSTKPKRTRVTDY